MKPVRKRRSLSDEVIELRARLDEAEQTLDAIRSGRVDALVVSGPSGDRVFTLQGADHRYRRIVQGMTEGAAIISPEGWILYANASFARMVSTPLAAVLGSKLLRYVPERAAPTIERLIRDGQAGSAAAGAEIVGAEGKILPVHVSAVADGEAEYGGICLIVTDLSEALRHEEQRFQFVADMLPLIVWSARADGWVDWYNRRWADYSPLTRTETERWGFAPVLHPEDLQKCVEAWSRSVATGAPYEVTCRFRRAADGVYRWHLCRAFPQGAEDGSVLRWYGTCTDIDDWQRLQEELAGERESLALLAEVSVTIATSIDYDETLARIAHMALPHLAERCTLHLLEEDGTLTEVLASQAPESSLEVVRSSHPPGHPSPLSPQHTRVLQSGQSETLPRDAERQSPSRMLVPLIRLGKTIGVMTFLSEQRPYGAGDLRLAEELGRRASLGIESARLYRDVKVAFDAERRARDRAEDATRLKDEFLATLSHELRTPLNAILGWGRMLQGHSLTPEKRVRGVEVIVRNALAQSQLIEDLLDVSRIITGKMRLSVTEVDVAAVVQAALDMVRPGAEAKGVRLQPLLDPDSGAIAGDAGRLQQIVSNLLTNAVKFTPKGGRVHVSLRRFESSVEISVTDTGLGIAGEFLPYVFDRFRQEDGAITRKSGGLGLGLAIVKSLVELHGGAVEAQSEGEGRGATFTIRLPISPVRVTPVPAERKSTSPLLNVETDCPSEIEGLKILVVDDDADARELMRAVLEQCGGIVTTAGSAAQALQAIQASPPAVIVSDIGMPEEDGYTFIRKLRALPREQGGRIPAVALTAYARPEDRRRALAEGFQSHAAKPIEPQELLLVLANLAGRYS